MRNSPKKVKRGEGPNGRGWDYHQIKHGIAVGLIVAAIVGIVGLAYQRITSSNRPAAVEADQTAGPSVKDFPDDATKLEVPPPRKPRTQRIDASGKRPPDEAAESQ